MSLRSLMKKNYLMQTKYLWKFSKSSVVSFCNLSPLGYVSCQQQSKDFLFSDVKLNLIRSKRFVSNQPNIREIDHKKNLINLLYRMNNDIQTKNFILSNHLQDCLRCIDCGAELTAKEALPLLRSMGGFLVDEPLAHRRLKAENFWKKLKELNIDLDITHYNSKISIDIENDQEFDIDELFKTLKENNIEPNRITYQHIISKLGIMGKHEEAQKYLEIMKEKEMPINESIFGSLIQGYIISGDMQSADGILQIVKDTDLDLDHVVHSYISSMILSGKSFEEINNKIKYFEDENIRFNRQIANNYLLELVCVGKLIEAEQFYNERLIGKMSFSEMRILIPQLIFNGGDEIAFKILTNINGQNAKDPSKNGSFFIRALINQNQSIDKIINYIILLKKYVNEEIVNRTIEVCIYMGKLELSQQILARCQKELGVDCFVPALSRSFSDIYFRSKNDSKDLTKTLKALGEMKFPLNGRNIRKLLEMENIRSMKEIIDKYSEFKNSIPFSYYINNSLFYAMLNSLNTIDVLNCMMAYRHIITLERFVFPVAKSFIEGNQEYFKMLMFLSQIYKKNNEPHVILTTFRWISTLAEEKDSQSEFNYIFDALKCLNVLHIAPNKQLYEGMDFFQDKRVQDLLKKNYENRKNIEKYWTKTRLNNHIHSFDYNNLAFNPKNSLVIPKDSNLDETLKLMKQNISESNFYPNLNDLEIITDRFIKENRAKEIYPLIKEIVLNDAKIYSSTFGSISAAIYDELTQEEWNEHLKMASDFKNTVGNWEEKFLRQFSQNHKSEDSLKLFRYFQQQNNIMDNEYLESLFQINGFFYENKIDEAIEILEKIIVSQKKAPNVKNILINLIENDNHDKTEYLKELLIKNLNRNITFYKILYCYLYCGKYQYARKLVKNSSINYNKVEVEFIIDMLIDKNDLKGLENFVSMSRSFSKHSDREILFGKIIETYKKFDDAKEKISQIEIIMEEENFIPSSKLKRKMSIKIE